MGSSLIVCGLITYKSSRPDSEKGCGTELSASQPTRMPRASDDISFGVRRVQ